MRRTILWSVLLLVSVLGTVALADSSKIQGMIKARNGDTMTVKTQNAQDVTVLLTETTEVSQIQGVFQARRKEMAMAALIPGVPTHGDAQPRNFLWDAPDERLALIDFERAEVAPAVRDLVRLEYGPWDGRADLRASFLAGYGRTLTGTEEAALRSFAALDALK